MTANDIDTYYSAYDATANITPNGAMGTNQFLEAANSYVQAYDRDTGYPILYKPSYSTSPGPQPALNPWTALSTNYCATAGDEYTVAYDHVDSVWVLATQANVKSDGNYTDAYACVAVSAADDLTTSATWYAYAFDLSSLLPVHGSTTDYTDYMHFASWRGEYYITFDLIDPGTGIEGWVACQLTQSTMVGGGSAAATCYDYLPTTVPSLIHSVLPADAESNSFPTTSLGEYFIGIVNPDAHTQNQSDYLAFWTWSDIESKGAYTDTKVQTQSPYTPGCWDSGNPPNTVCVPQYNTTQLVDSVGDRLMSRLAYRYFSPCDDDSITALSCEYLAVTQTVNEGSDYSVPTGIRYYGLVAPTGSQTKPSILYEEDFTNSSYYYWMSSNAIDEDQNVGYQFSVAPASQNAYPSLDYDTLSNLGAAGTATTVPYLSYDGSEGDNPDWGYWVSTTIDPADNVSFWSVGGYYPNGTQTSCIGGDGFSGCNWGTAIFCRQFNSTCPYGPE
jgi:hypothetical protein